MPAGRGPNPQCSTFGIEVSATPCKEDAQCCRVLVMLSRLSHTHGPSHPILSQVLGCAGVVDPPAALAGLPNLQRCYLHGYYVAPPGAGADEAPPLPGGPWLASLR